MASEAKRLAVAHFPPQLRVVRIRLDVMRVQFDFRRPAPLARRLVSAYDRSRP